MFIWQLCLATRSLPKWKCCALHEWPQWEGFAAAGVSVMTDWYPNDESLERAGAVSHERA